MRLKLERDNFQSIKYLLINANIESKLATFKEILILLSVIIL